MRKTVKRLFAALLCVLQLTLLLPLSVGAEGTSWNVAGITIHEYSGGVQAGTIRYVWQRGNLEENGWGDSAGTVDISHQCNSATESMALSYLGIDMSPEELIGNEEKATDTAPNRDWTCHGLELAVGCSGETTFSDDAGKAWTVNVINRSDVSESAISELVDSFENGNGKVSPVMIHYNNGSVMHWILIVGKKATNCYYAIGPGGNYSENSVSGEKRMELTISGNSVTITAGYECGSSFPIDQFGQYVVLAGSAETYLDQCDFFPSAGTVTVTAKTYMKTYPCSRKTDENSDDILKATKGEVYDVTGLYRNSVGNYWFRIGIGAEMGYLYAGDVSFTVADEYKSSGDCFYSTDGKTLKGYIDGTKKSFDSSYVYSAYDDVSENCCYHLYLAANESVVLDAQGDENNTANCSNVWLYKKTSAASSLWSFTKASGGWYVISPESNTGLALNPYAAEPVNGTNVNVYSKNTTDSTMGWYVDAAGDGTYIIRNAYNTSLVLTAEGSSAGSNVYVANYDASNALQRWKISG